MKISHTVNKNLSSKESLDLSKSIIDSLYKIDPEIGSIYDIHVNLVDGEWFIDFIASNGYPQIKVDTYAVTKSNQTILKINPISLSDVPKTISFDGDVENLDTYIMILEYISDLYNFQFKL